MGPTSYGGMEQYAGPLTIGARLGEQHDNSMAESRNQQAWTLEQVEKSKQDRDFAKQKLPGELAQQQATLEGTRATTGLTGMQTETGKQKLDHQKVLDWTDQAMQYEPTGNTINDMYNLQEMAKKGGLDEKDPRIQRLLEAARAGKLAEVRAKIVANAPANMEKRKQEEQEMAKVKEQGSSHERVANIQAASQRYAADQRLKAAQAKAAQGANAMKNKSFAEAYNYYKQAADDAAAAGDMTAAQVLMTRAQEALAAAQAVAGAGRNTPQAGALTVSPEGGLQTNQPQALPQSAAPNPAAARPGAAQAGAPPVVTPPPPAPAPAAQPSAIARPANKAERDALPTGAQYVGPDGQTYTKR